MSHLPPHPPSAHESYGAPGHDGHTPGGYGPPGHGAYGAGMSPMAPADQMHYSAQTMAGEKAAQLSLVLGIVSLFFIGIVLGPLAIWQAGKAERMNRPATAGKVLGWIGTLVGIAQIVIAISAIGTLLAMMSQL